MYRWKKYFYSTLLVTISWTMISCDGTGGAGTPVPIPDVFIDCTASKCQVFGTFTAFVSISTFGCDLDFGGLVASGSTTGIVCNGSRCSGTVGTWVNAQTSELMTEIGSREYYYCARIDFGNDAFPNLSDAYSSTEQLVLAETNIDLDDWSASCEGSLCSASTFGSPFLLEGEALNMYETFDYLLQLGGEE